MITIKSRIQKKKQALSRANAQTNRSSNKPTSFAQLRRLTSQNSQKKSVKQSPASLHLSQLTSNTIDLTPTITQTPRTQPARPFQRFNSLKSFSAYAQQSMTPKIAITRFPLNLTAQEQSEIQNYPEVYYVGTEQKRNLREGQVQYDDRQLNYNIILGDHIAYRYEIQEVVGSGTFATVVKALDHKTQEIVAVKIVKNVASMRYNAEKEIQILERLNQEKCQFIVQMKDSFNFRGHLCMVLEYHTENLYEFQRRHIALSEKVIKDITISLLQGLKILRANKIIHCDIKPENIVITQQNQLTNIRIIDFGTSCFQGLISATYIQSRYYRAPEVVFGCNYSTQIDMWSLGCVLVELATGRPLFPAQTEGQLIKLITSVLGYPPEDLIIRGKRAQLFVDQNFQLSHDLEPDNLTNFYQILSGFSEGFISFIENCIVWHPRQRMTPEKALSHSWLNIKKRHMGLYKSDGDIDSPHRSMNTLW